MNTLVGWIFIIIGVLMLLPLIGLDIGEVGSWLVMLGFLVIGIMALTNKK